MQIVYNNYTVMEICDYQEIIKLTIYMTYIIYLKKYKMQNYCVYILSRLSNRVAESFFLFLFVFLVCSKNKIRRAIVQVNIGAHV
jgi:hypothetical protein